MRHQTIIIGKVTVRLRRHDAFDGGQATKIHKKLTLLDDISTEPLCNESQDPVQVILSGYKANHRAPEHCGLLHRKDGNLLKENSSKINRWVRVRYCARHTNLRGVAGGTMALRSPILGSDLSSRQESAGHG